MERRDSGTSGSEVRKVLGLGMAVLALTLASATARAQNAAAPDIPAAPPPAQDVIGPDQLRDFSLNGTVTRRADPQPATQTPRRPSQPTTAESSPAGSPSSPVARRAPSAPRLSPSPAAPTDSPATAQAPRRPLMAAPEPSFSAPIEPTTMPAAGMTLPDEGAPLLLWLLAGLAAAAAAAFYFWRQRLRPAYAGGATVFDRELAEAERAPAPPPAAPSPVGPSFPEASPLSPSGAIVSSRLRPWLEVEFAPARCIYADDGAVIEFEASLFNSGAAPARDILLEARLFNAGQAQDEEVSAFFAHPQAHGNRIREIPPLKRISVKSAVSLTREQLRAYRLEERLLWVPTIAVTALYRWSGGQGQTSASFILGRETKGEKMAAFRLDQGSRVFRGLGARPHTVGVRK